MAEEAPRRWLGLQIAADLLSEVFKANDPILATITFFMGLRNQIEHRHESQIAALVAAKPKHC